MRRTALFLLIAALSVTVGNVAFAQVGTAGGKTVTTEGDDLFINLEDDASLEAAKEDEVDEEAIPFQLVEVRPSFMGGDANTFSKWVNEHLVYPEDAKKNGIQGRVTLQFTVNTDGIVSNVVVIRGVDPDLDKEAVRVVSSSPKWTPGKTRDRVVRVCYTFPIVFNLR